MHFKSSEYLVLERLPFIIAIDVVWFIKTNLFLIALDINFLDRVDML